MNFFSENFTWTNLAATNRPPFLSSCPTTLLIVPPGTLQHYSLEAPTRSIRPTWNGFQWCYSWLACSVVVLAQKTYLSCWLRSISLQLCGHT